MMIILQQTHGQGRPTEHDKFKERNRIRATVISNKSINTVTRG